MGGSILKFLALSELIFILLTVLAFIPSTILVFTVKAPTFQTDNFQQVYMNARKQIQKPFIIDLLRNNQGQPFCSYREALLNNQLCFMRANKQNYWVIENTSKNCSDKYTKSQYTYCSGTTSSEQIKNRFIQNQQIDSDPKFVHSDSYLPIFSIYLKSAMSQFSQEQLNIVYYTHITNDQKQQCQKILTQLQQDIENQAYHQFYSVYKRSLLSVWIIMTILLLVLSISIIINKINSKINARSCIVYSLLLTNTLFIAINAEGISYFRETQNFKQKINQFSSCFIQPTKSTIEKASLINFGLERGFVFFLGVLCFIVGLIMIGQVIVKFIEHRIYSSRQDYIQNGYQLQPV